MIIGNRDVKMIALEKTGLEKTNLPDYNTLLSVSENSCNIK
jgi:hypothetical protein